MPQLDEVLLGGSILASFLTDCGERGNSEGLLLGSIHTVVTTFTEDNAEAREKETLHTGKLLVVCEPLLDRLPEPPPHPLLPRPGADRGQCSRLHWRSGELL
jgi:hypothetical protein